MKPTVAAIMVGIGLVVGGLGWVLLPPERGRYEYAIAVVDPRPLSKSQMSEGLAALEGVRVERAIVMERPDGEAGPGSVLMLPNPAGHLKSPDLGLGRVPERGSEALAGAASGLGRGEIRLAGHAIEICGVLASLGPLFDESLWMEPSEYLAAALQDAGWEAEVRYVLFAETLGERKRLLAQLEAAPELLPAPEAKILSSEQPRPLPGSAEMALGLGLALVGATLIWRNARVFRELAGQKSGRRERG